MLTQNQVTIGFIKLFHSIKPSKVKAFKSGAIILYKRRQFFDRVLTHGYGWISEFNHIAIGII